LLNAVAIDLQELKIMLHFFVGGGVLVSSRTACCYQIFGFQIFQILLGILEFEILAKLANNETND